MSGRLYACKKMSCCICDLACKWLIVENVKMLNVTTLWHGRK